MRSDFSLNTVKLTLHLAMQCTLDSNTRNTQARFEDSICNATTQLILALNSIKKY